MLLLAQSLPDTQRDIRLYFVVAVLLLAAGVGAMWFARSAARRSDQDETGTDAPPDAADR